METWYPAKLRLQIAAKSVATKIKEVLAYLDKNDQTGFLKARYIEKTISD